MLLLCLVAAAAFTSCGGWGGSFGYDGGTDLDAGTGTDTDADSGADTNGANFYRLP